MVNDALSSTRGLPQNGAPRTWKLLVRSDAQERVRVLRRGESLVLGHGEMADWDLPDDTVSARHCKITATGEGLHLRDLGSKNGTYVGAGRVTEAILGGPKAVFSVGCTSVEAEDRNLRVQSENMGLLGDSEAIVRVRRAIAKFAKLRGPVLIVGESGTGKDVVARALHVQSERTGNYLPLNVAALPDTLLDAELFGHERGAFTGALQARSGLFQMAAGGTLFLDEIADLSASGQAKLLRVVEDGKVRSIGSNKEKRVETRLVSATCVPLASRIETGRFRHDLYHRLSMLVIEIPPLRNRLSDIRVLAEHYLQRIAPEVGRKHLVPATLDALRRRSWPGNVRELFGVLYRAAALCPGDTIHPGQVLSGESVRRGRPRLVADRAAELLNIHGSISAAARAAGVPRTTFRSVLEREKLRTSR